MLSVLIETRNDEEGLARTLASLVGGAVEGVVREVVVCDLGSTDHSHYVAEHAGCAFVGSGGIKAGIEQAKSDWLLLLEPGARLGEGWAEEAMRHTGRLTMAARFSRARESNRPLWARIFGRPRALEQGLVITKRQATVLARNGADAEGIARGLAMKTLNAEIAVAPRR
ncbi:glycosyltransferase family 2 protein [Mesorhizobium sp. ANAO-SY3R2]|uniref:glycosyltransferase family 2 protein n=1 Tax=Mesorhizobium sp. ANAO-SY3R2 TaxID=3166644 RepID=UPI00366DACAE